MRCYIMKTRTRTNGWTQNDNEKKTKITAVRTNENEKYNGKKRSCRSRIHSPVTIANTCHVSSIDASC